MSDEENSGIFSRRKDYERRVPVAISPLPNKESPTNRWGFPTFLQLKTLFAGANFTAPWPASISLTAAQLI